MFDVIPAIDLIDGACVRLTKGDYSRKKVYSGDPLEVAKAYEAIGLRRLHLVDLDGARSGGIVNHKVLERIATQTGLIVDFGGGIKRDEDIKQAFECGAAMVTGGSIAVKDPERFLGWLKTYGPQRIILGADVSDGFVAVSGWQEASEVTGEQLILSYAKEGLKKVISTEISRDGMLSGPSFELYASITEALDDQGFTDLELIASGGVSCFDDLLKLEAQGLSGVIVGKAIYEGRITLEKIAEFQRSCNPDV
ncbi:MAG: 1-(5-phosphoribosyl)-5-[(5-phosphoribosylamino)methylideneamino]imidazole-4-carboxamide isomerase [Spirochaetia bacterium]|nr:1-(5-phosphoribosyl)-5-[(5-phosphoribosylamino)methylideneamino]imidazole-4-carboxamide isomerase [Spirochaetia bacterium]